MKRLKRDSEKSKNNETRKVLTNFNNIRDFNDSGQDKKKERTKMMIIFVFFVMKNIKAPPMKTGLCKLG